MKIIKILLVPVICLTLFSFKSVIIKKIDTENSLVKWTGYKVTGQHEGTITLKKGELKFDGDSNLIGGVFDMDMTSINTTDLDGGSKDRLDSHLKNDDFFSVSKYKTANLVFTKIMFSRNENDYKNYAVDGDLTIKGITNPISFEINIYKNSASVDLKIDRTKFNIKYGSASFFDGLKDRAIYDEFDLEVRLKF